MENDMARQAAERDAATARKQAEGASLQLAQAKRDKANMELAMRELQAHPACSCCFVRELWVVHCDSC